MNISVFGAGSWGTALTILLARNDHEVRLVGRNPEEIQVLTSVRENLHYLPGFAIPPSVSFHLLSEEQPVSDLVVLAIPCHAFREVAGRVPAGTGVAVVATKGLDATTGKLMLDVLHEVAPPLAGSVLSGPNLAVEIARGVPTVAVAAATDLKVASQVQAVFQRSTYRVSTSDDVIGVELAGALKNVLAIGGGMSDGLGFGDNTKGAFLSRGLMEMARLGVAMGARLETFLGPAGVGDLFATAVSQLSRNYRLGYALGQGSTLREAIERVGQVAEGVPSSEAAVILGRKLQVDIPVMAAVESVIRGRVAARSAVAMLMERATKPSEFKT